METWTRELELPASIASVARAREFTIAALVDAGLAELVDDARLIVSELASNAVLHAGTPFALRIDLGPEGVLLSIRDGSTRPAARANADPYGERGRGLLLVEVLSSEWGIDPRDSGKAVWARLSTGSGTGMGGSLPGEEGRSTSVVRPSVTGPGQSCARVSSTQSAMKALMCGMWSRPTCSAAPSSTVNTRSSRFGLLTAWS
jgi:anti-sigma regulatory factor (Ser/Thr protein kinase)